MNKREQAALKAYPDDTDTLQEVKCILRTGFIKGYEQAEKDTIERSVEWLKKHADNYNGSESSFDHMEEEMIADFHKAMEEE